LVNAQGIMAAAVTANPPSDYYFDGDPTIVSTSDSRVYYEDGNSDIDYLTSTGKQGIAFTVNRPIGAEVAFAVSPDGSRVVVSILTNFNGLVPPYTSHMYLMAIGGRIQKTLFDGNSTSSTAPLTWPVGWDGDNLIVGQSLAADFGGYSPGTGPCSGGSDCASQLRVFNPANETFGPPLCAASTGSLTGAPTAAGIACGAGPGASANTPKLAAVSWSGVVTSFGSNGGGPSDSQDPWGGSCMLSPHGAVIACASDILDDGPIPAQAFRAGGVVQELPNPLDFPLLGWLDGNDVVVTTGGSFSGNSLWGLDVENIVTGRRIPVSLSNNPDPLAPWQFFGVIPGAL
jgi:hypothetical protein